MIWNVVYVIKVQKIKNTCFFENDKEIMDYLDIYSDNEIKVAEIVKIFERKIRKREEILKNLNIN